MKNKLMKVISIAAMSIVLVIPGGVSAQAAVKTTGSESAAVTETKIPKLSSNLKNLKGQLAGLANIDLGKLDKVDVSTVDKVKVILDNSNIDIDINLINININKK